MRTTTMSIKQHFDLMGEQMKFIHDSLSKKDCEICYASGYTSDGDICENCEGTGKTNNTLWYIQHTKKE